MIFVTGCARSGTSLITKILKAHGCYLGRSDRINVLFENISIRENILKSFLMRIGADPLGQDKLPETDRLPIVPDLHDRVMSYFEEGFPPFAYKDAKLTLVWPVFHQAFPQAHWVLVRREREQIIDSCMRTTFMRKRRTREQWEAWVAAHEAQFDAMHEKLDLVEVWTDKVVADARAFNKVAVHCGLHFNKGAVERAVDPRLWHAKGALNAARLSSVR